MGRTEAIARIHIGLVADLDRSERPGRHMRNEESCLVLGQLQIIGTQVDSERKLHRQRAGKFREGSDCGRDGFYRVIRGSAANPDQEKAILDW